MVRSKSAKERFLLYKFDLFDSSILLTDRLEPYTNAMGTFVSFPHISPSGDIAREEELDLSSSGTQALNIEIPAGDFPEFDRLAQGYPSAAINITLLEVILDFDSSEENYLFRGTLAEIEKADPHTITMIFMSYITNADRTLGIVFSADCPWTFGGSTTCKFDIESVKVSATVSAIDRNKITLSSNLTAPRKHYWAKGFIKKDGIQIPIKFWVDYEPNVLVCSTWVPQDWVNEIITVYPGCSKTVNACREWNNEDRFGGIGAHLRLGTAR